MNAPGWDSCKFLTENSQKYDISIENIKKSYCHKAQNLHLTFKNFYHYNLYFMGSCLPEAHGNKTSPVGEYSEPAGQGIRAL